MKLNSVIKYLTIADFALLSGFALISPIFAVFIMNSIKGGNLKVVGFATAINVLTKAIFELPIARYLDKKRGDMDEYYFTFIGSAFLAIVPLFYLFITTPLELYIVQLFYGIGLAMNYPGWMSLFTRHAEKEREGSQWAIYSSITGIGAAGAAAIGGLIGEKYGFDLVFLSVCFMSVLGTVILVKIYKPLKLRHEHHHIKQEEAFKIKGAEKNQ